MIECVCYSVIGNVVLMHKIRLQTACVRHKMLTEIFTLLGCYAAQIASELPTFRDDLLVPSSKVKHPTWTAKSV